MLLRSSLLFIGVFVVVNTANARVAGMSAVKNYVDSAGVSVTEVVVRCSTSKGVRRIVKKGNSTQWCDSKVVSVCAGEKLKAAKNVCASNYKQLLDEQLASASGAAPVQQVTAAEPKPAIKEPTTEKIDTRDTSSASSTVALSKAELAAAQAELLDIEQKRVQIRQRQLELRKLELELQKQRAADVESGF